ncbi:MAG: DUF1553 domain-containing protein [Verrucomicrobiales bacterium]|nr:DUF1553 domain-containing protein [Verrucomicrobiales bacterium]
MQFRFHPSRLRPHLVAWVVICLTRTALGAASSPAPSAKAEIDIQARKQAQPWLWEAPQAATPPPVRDPGWPRDAVDRFILHRLETAGLSPAAVVDDRTWLRRVSFGITGLPPTRDEIQEFLSDSAPGARERVVTRLLASPHFGERWARHWMDLMRYAETRGHEGDYAIANAWQYRDYLIRAFNEDVPYDQFLREHLAGDLVQPPRLRPGTRINESVLGTGWAFLGEENHSPVDIRQDECDRLDNKVDVFTKSFLGLTVSCARCHDHKFDPIRTRDYYALTGFLLGSSYRQVRFETMENNREQAGELQKLRDAALPALAAGIATSSRDILPRIPPYLTAAAELWTPPGTPPSSATPDRAIPSGLDPETLNRWKGQLTEASSNRVHALHGFVRRLQHASNEVSGSTQDHAPAGLRVLADFTRPGVQPWKADGEAFGRGPLPAGSLIPGTRAEDPIAGVLTYGAARRDPFWNRLANAAGNEDDSGRLGATARSGRMVRTPTFELADGHVHYLIRGKTRVYAAVDGHIMLEGPLHGVLTKSFDTGPSSEPRWVTHDLSPYSGHRTHIEFGPDGDAPLEILAVVESQEVPAWNPVAATVALSEKATTPAELAAEITTALAEACDWMAGLEASRNQPPPSDRILVAADWILRNRDWLGIRSGADVQEKAARYFQAESEIAARVQWTSRTALSWFDGTGVDENILVRGKPFSPGGPAPRSLPEAIPGARPITDGASSGRRELADQLTDPGNPLVARVLVNRVWHHLFGRGLVPTVDNFGALGERPTDPELLDYLAWQFVHEDHWSLKRLIHRLVLTQTYSMSHRDADPRAQELDPANHLWHHIPVRRLEAEAIRDSLLTVSGRLNPAVGGPPVPVYLNEFTVGRGRPDKSGPLDGDGRRSLYLAMRRNFLSPALLAFDAPTPFSTVGKRNVTNVPAQSLALMNDPLFHEQARVWAQRMLRERPSAEAAERVAWLFESAYGRLPTAAESRDCLETLADLRQLHGAEATDAESWTDLCHALLNANDFIYVM